MILECPKCGEIYTVDDNKPLRLVRSYRCPSCNWYLRPAASQTFKCSNCGRIRHLKSIPTSNLCRRCAAKQRRTSPNVPVSLGENLVVTTVVEKRLRKKAEKDIPRLRAEITARKVEISIWAVLVLSLYTGLPALGWWALGILIGIPIAVRLLINGILANPRRERKRQVKLRIQELAEERKRNIEEAKLFYSSPEWLKIREQVIKEEGRTCVQCGRLIKKANDVTVDHIRPRSKYPHLAFNRENLRVLCRRCNSQKKDREWLEVLQ